jgi:hypothetical protein
VMLTEFVYMIKGGLVAWPKGDCQFLIEHIVESKQGTWVKDFRLESRSMYGDVSRDSSWILF